MDLALTIPVERGCGKRKAGAVYLALGVGEGGREVWDYLLDPPVPVAREPWQGVEVVQENETAVVLGDYVSEADYPTIAHFVEEVRRFGLSRLIPRTFDFERLRGKEVYLALFHRKAVPTGVPIDRRQAYFRLCKMRETEGHYRRCVYHAWAALASKGERVVGASFEADPAAIAQAGDWSRAATAAGWMMGAFAIFPITHLEAVKAAPKAAVGAGLPVVVREE